MDRLSHLTVVRAAEWTIPLLFLALLAVAVFPSGAAADNGWAQSPANAQASISHGGYKMFGQAPSNVRCEGIPSSGSQIVGGSREYGRLRCIVRYLAKRPFPDRIWEVRFDQLTRDTYRLTGWRQLLTGGFSTGSCVVKGHLLYLESISCLTATSFFLTFLSGSMKAINDRNWTCQGTAKRSGVCNGPGGTIVATQEGFVWLAFEPNQ